MSQAAAKKIPLKQAQALGRRLIARFMPEGREDEAHVAGSVRRCKAEVNDIELILPWHDAADDPVWRTMAPYIVARRDEGLFSPPDGPRPELAWFDDLLGFKAGFLHTTLFCDPAVVWPTARDFPAFKVDVYRYTPGPAGNFGSVMLVRTGPAQFGEAVMAWWKARGGRSEGNYFIDAADVKLPQDTEERAFALLGLEWVDPISRFDRDQLRARRGG